MDSGLEAFSHNPTDGSFTAMAVQPTVNTNYLNQRFLSYWVELLLQQNVFNPPGFEIEIQGEYQKDEISPHPPSSTPLYDSGTTEWTRPPYHYVPPKLRRDE